MKWNRKIAEDLGIPSLPILDPLIDLLSDFVGQKGNRKIGAQHKMNKAIMKEWHGRIPVTHDDGMNIDNLDGAEILIVGVSEHQKHLHQCICK